MYDVYNNAGELLASLSACSIYSVYKIAPDELVWAIEEHGVCTVAEFQIVAHGDLLPAEANSHA